MKKLALMICAVFISALAFAVSTGQASAYHEDEYYDGYRERVVYKTTYKKPVKKAAVKKTTHRRDYGNRYYQADDHAHVKAYPRMAARGGHHYYSYHHQPDGKVLLTWDERRGATCHISYTEAGGDAYQYRTAAPCEEGVAVIGGLEPGVEYKFAVSPDHKWYTGEHASAHATAHYVAWH